MMFFGVVVAVLALLGGASMALGALRERARDPSAVARSRLLRHEMVVQVRTVREVELSTSLVERVWQPVLATLRSLISRLTPETETEVLQRRLGLAGNPMHLDPLGFQLVRLLSAVLLASAGILIGVLIHQTTFTILGGAVGLLIGFILPVLWLNQLIGNRRRGFDAELAEDFDIVAISLEAGLSFEASLSKLAEAKQDAVGFEIRRALHEMSVGRPRDEALADLAARMGVGEMDNLFRAIAQAEVSGVPIARIVRVTIAQIRDRRRTQLKIQAAQASLKMLLPAVGCIFPVIWIILLGPAGLVAAKLLLH